MAADLVVVGAGIVGAFVAYQACTREPAADVVLLDRGDPRRRASTWSLGADFAIAPTAGHRELVDRSRELYTSLDGEAAQSRRAVSMIFVVPVGSATEFTRRYARPLAAATEPGLLRGSLSRRCARAVRDDEVLLVDPCGAVVDANRMAAALVEAARGEGRLRVYRGVDVQDVSPGRPSVGRGWRHTITTDRGSWDARRVVTATGPWPAPGLAVDDVRPKRVAALVVATRCALGDPLTYFVADDLFVLPSADREAYVSFYCDDWDVDLAEEPPVDWVLVQGRAALTRRLPGLDEAVVGVRVFADSYAPGRLPTVTPAHPGIAVVSGTSGSGVRLAPALAERALQLVGFL